MKLHFKTCSQNDEHLMFIIIKDDDNKEISKIPIYVKDEDDQKLPGLKAALTDIENLFKMIYESGKKQENIEFTESSETF